MEKPRARSLVKSKAEQLITPADDNEDEIDGSEDETTDSDETDCESVDDVCDECQNGDFLQEEDQCLICKRFG